MSSHSSKRTTNHNEIRRWAESRGAKPACVKGTGGNGDPGMIRLDFPGYSGADSLQEISWDDWFRAFDDNELALLYQEETAGGERSNFNKLVSRDSGDDARHQSSHNDSSRAASGAGAKDDLASREYRDAHGDVHHHTHVYMEQHGRDGRGDSRS